MAHSMTKPSRYPSTGDLQPDLARCCGINDALIGRCPFSLVDHLAEKRRKRVVEEEPPTFRFGCGPPIEALHDCLRVACQAVRVPKVGDERMIDEQLLRCVEQAGVRE